MSFRLDTAPAIEPISVAEAKCQIDIDHHDDDTLIAGKIKTVRLHFERLLWQAFINQTWKLRLQCFPTEFVLPPGRLQSVTSITYTDTAGNSQTVSSSDYVVNTFDTQGVVQLASGASWPATKDIANAVIVEYVAGFGSAASDVPQDIIDALTVAVEHAYKCSGDWTGIIDSVWPLLEPHKVTSADALEFVS